MKYLNLSAKIYLWANFIMPIQFLLVINVHDELLTVLESGIIIFILSALITLPSIFFLTLCFSLLSNKKLHPLACWLFLVTTVLLIIIMAALLFDYYLAAFQQVMIMGSISASISLLVKSQSIHNLFLSFLYETE